VFNFCSSLVKKKLVVDEFQRFHGVSARAVSTAIETKFKSSRFNSTAASVDKTRFLSNLKTVLHSTSVEGFVHLMEQFVSDLAKVILLYFFHGLTFKVWFLLSCTKACSIAILINKERMNQQLC